MSWHRGSLAAMIGAILLTSACSSRKSLGELAFKTVGTAETVRLSQCPTPKCLTVYVAPWCHYCREATPLIIALRDYLKERHVATRVIVGSGDPGAVKEYALLFGPDTLLDAPGELQLSGVPHFLVTDQQGNVTQDVAGMPQVPKPWDAEVMEWLAARLGLP